MSLIVHSPHTKAVISVVVHWVMFLEGNYLQCDRYLSKMKIFNEIINS